MYIPRLTEELDYDTLLDKNTFEQLMVESLWPRFSPIQVLVMDCTVSVVLGCRYRSVPCS